MQSHFFERICSPSLLIIESRMSETIQEINKKDSIFESDVLDTELRILDWLFYQVCVNMQDQTGIRTIQSDKF